MAVSHLHADIEINFVEAGEVEYFIGGRFEVMESGSLHFFWAGIPHAVTRVAPASAMQWVVIPLAWFLQWDVDSGLADDLLQGRIWDVKQPSALQRGLLAQWCEDFSANESPVQRRKVVALEAEALLRRIALEAKPRPQRARNTFASGGAAMQAEKLAEFASRHYTKELTIQEIACAVKLHPNYAMQLFREKCGLSLWEYVLRLRVSHAQYLLLTSARKLSDIARASGFASDSRFYAAFEKYSGCSPRAWRERIGVLRRDER